MKIAMVCTSVLDNPDDTQTVVLTPALEAGMTQAWTPGVRLGMLLTNWRHGEKFAAGTVYTVDIEPEAQAGAVAGLAAAVMEIRGRRKRG